VQYVLAETLPRLLLAVAQLPLLSWAHVGALNLPTKTRRGSVQS
jgi:hypothetical protein